MADRAGQLGGLPAGRVARLAPPHDELVEHGIYAAHVAVALQAHHVSGAVIGMLVKPGMFHKVAGGLYAMLPAPPGDAAIHGAAPGLRQGVQVLVARRDLRLARQFRFVGGVGQLPIHAPLSQHAVEFGAPVAGSFGFIIKEAPNGLPKIGSVALEVRLVNGLQIPIHAIPARAVHRELPAADLQEAGGLGMGEFEDAPFAAGNRPAKRARMNVRSEIHQRVGVYLAFDVQPPGQSGNIPFAAVSLRLEKPGPFHLDRRRCQPFGRVARRHFAGHRLARPPFFVKDPELEIVLFGGAQADVQIPPPTGAEPVVVRSRFGGKAAIAALGHLADVQFQPLLAFITVQPEQRSGKPPGFSGQLPELLFQGRQARTGCGDRRQRPSQRTERRGGNANGGEKRLRRFHDSLQRPT